MLKVAVLTLVVFVSIPSFAKEFKCNWGEYNPEPYIILKSGNLKPTGIIPDLCSALANQLNETPKLVQASRKRSPKFCLAGTTDIVLISNKKWAKPLLDQPWLPSYFTENEKLVFSEKSKHLADKKLEEIGKITIATTLGFKYNNELFNQNIEKGTWKRFDVKNEAAAIKMVIANRLEAAIVKDISFNYRQKKSSETNALTLSKFILNSTEISPVLCGKVDKTRADQIEKAMRSIVKNGEVKKIFEKYK